MKKASKIKKISKINKISNIKKELYIKILILIILFILLGITSFNTGKRFFVLVNADFGETKGIVNTNVARWNFDVKIIVENEVIKDE